MYDDRICVVVARNNCDQIGVALPLKSILPLASVWSKTTLNTGGLGGAGADVQT